MKRGTRGQILERRCPEAEDSLSHPGREVELRGWVGAGGIGGVRVTERWELRSVSQPNPRLTPRQS